MIGDEHRARFETDGYFVLESALGPEWLETLRAESDAAVLAEEDRIRAAGGVEVDRSVLGQRYYVAGRSRHSPTLVSFLRGELAADICRAVLGPSAYLFTEVFVSKMPGQTRNYGWHQDYSYLDYYKFGDYPPNLSVWIALDDTTEENGALRVLPFSKGGPRHAVPHDLSQNWESGQLVDFGGLEGEVVPMSAGSLIAFSGLLAHTSGPNRSSHPRRAYLIQYSERPILHEGRLLEQAVPVIEGGRRAGV